jgi:hypothetical protein
MSLFCTLDVDCGCSDRVFITNQRSSSFTFLGTSMQVPKSPKSQTINFQHMSSFNELNITSFSNADIYQDQNDANVKGVSNHLYEVDNNYIIPGRVLGDMSDGDEVNSNNEGIIIRSTDMEIPLPSHDEQLSRVNSINILTGFGQIYSKISTKVPFLPFSSPQLSRNESIESSRAQINGMIFPSITSRGKDLDSVNVRARSESNKSYVGISFRSFVDSLKDNEDIKGTNKIYREANLGNGVYMGMGHHYPLSPDHPSIKKLESFATKSTCIVDGNDLVRL